MRLPRYHSHISFLLLLCLFLIFSVSESRRVGIGMYLLNAASIDTLNGLWTGEAMVYFYEEDNGTFVPRLPYIANYGGFPTVSTIVSSIGATNVLQRLIFSPRPSDYPFDEQKLEFAVEDASWASEADLSYFWMEDYSGVSADIRLKGWSWDPKTKGTGVVKTHTYFGGHKVSQFSWTFNVKRAKVVAVQVLLPPIFVLVSVLISFIMPITASITRIGIVGSALISEVSLHSGFKNANGTTGTLGLIDFFFILTYSILVISLSINVIIMILLRKNDKSPLAVYLESRTKYFVWLVCPGLYTFIFFRGNLVWAAVICLVTPILIYAVIDALMPRFRAFQRKHRATERKKKEDAVFGDEETQAKLQENEGYEVGGIDTRKTAVDREIAKKQRRMHVRDNSESSGADLYDTDSE